MQCGANTGIICKEQRLNLTAGEKPIVGWSGGAVFLQVKCEEQHTHVPYVPEAMRARAGMWRSVEYETERGLPLRPRVRE